MCAHRPLSTVEVRKQNRNRVYRHLITLWEPVTKQELAFRLSMSLPTLSQNLNELAEMGLIDRSATTDSTGGRRPRLIAPLPNARFVNLYGPTEITCNCTYHKLQPERDYADGIPIGRHFPNEDVFLLDEQNHKITQPDAIGELCVRGTALALGYYCAPEQTATHFVQNPLNSCYPELIYRTGDLARYDENGELVFSGRKDFQIKYMGHRIELEEIERAISAIDGVERCCCLFDEKKSRLKGFYVGTIEKDQLHEAMKATLPVFMIPGFLRKVEEMPLTKNGKIDRKQLEALVGGKKK